MIYGKTQRRKAVFMVFAGIALGAAIFLTAHGAIYFFRDAAARFFVIPAMAFTQRAAVQRLSLFNNKQPEFSADMTLGNEKKAALIAERNMLQKENEALRSALRLSAERGRSVIPATPIGFFRIVGNEIIILNRGSEDDIQRGDVVMSNEGVYVGYVVSVGASRSDVLLATSRSQSIDVVFSSTFTRGRSRGASGREFVIEFIPQGIPIHKGEAVVVFGERHRAAFGMLLGEVREVSTDPAEVFQVIRALHSFDPFSAKALFVVKGEQR